jgi:NifB/MoaA-like Fe-S oxidoreductase
MLKSNERIFLDDVTVAELENKLGAKVTICKEDGSDFIKNILSI